MSRSTTSPTSPTVLFLGFDSSECIEDITKLSENERYIHTAHHVGEENDWRGEQCSGRVVDTVIQLAIGINMYSPQGWILGSSPVLDDCDIQLAASNASGISRRHLLIDIDPSSVLPRVTILSQRGRVRVATEQGELGKGMSASVIQVRERSTSRIYVAKEPHFNISKDTSHTIRDRLEKLKAEFKCLEKLKHPHIVQAFDLVVDGDPSNPPWLIMEYVPDFLDPTLIAKDEVFDILAQICSALAHMHANDIAHRDLKPDNILIDKGDRGSSPTVKLADFGTAKQSEGMMETFTGTQLYMAPELLHLPRAYTCQIDTYSLGLIAGEMIKSRQPLHERVDGMRAVKDQVKHQEWLDEVGTQIPSEFSHTLRGLLTWSPKDRWTAETCLLHLDNRSVRADPPAVDYDRAKRSPAPTVYTTRAEAVAVDDRGS